MAANQCASRITNQRQSRNGKTINPGCAFGYDPMDPSQGVDSKNAYHFYFQKGKSDKLVVSGSSAGGYGATLNLPYLIKSFPKADISLIPDGSTAIVAQGFLDSVFSDGGPWGLENTLDNDVSGFDKLNNFSVQTFNQTLLTGLASYYDDLKIAQYTTAWDVVQVQFLNIMKNPNNPALWANIPLTIFCEWNARMNESLSLTASVSNYRYYIGQGLVHTAFTDAFLPEIYYTESSGGVLLTNAPR